MKMTGRLIFLMSLLCQNLCLAKPHTATLANLSAHDLKVLQQSYKEIDANQLSCENFKEIYRRESIDLKTALLGVLFPGYAQYKRGEFAKAVLYGSGALAGHAYFFNTHVDASSMGLGTTLSSMLAFPFLGALSVYDASLSNKFQDPRLIGERKQLKSYLASPAKIKFLKDPRVYVKYPVYFLASNVLQHLSERVLGSVVKPGNTEVLEKVFDNIGKSGGSFYRVMSAASLSYLAATGEEAFFRGTLQPLLEEYAIKNSLKGHEVMADAPCGFTTQAQLIDRIQQLPEAERVQLRKNARQWGNALQAILFAAVHGNALAPAHLLMGWAFGDSQDGEEGVENGAFAHFWYDFLVMTHWLLSL